jgi:hypothetical protein
MTPTWPVPPGRSGNSTLLQATSRRPDGKEQAAAARGTAYRLAPHLTVPNPTVSARKVRRSISSRRAYRARRRVAAQHFGGSLGTGRIHGLWHIIEGTLQASGRAGSHQVKDANVSFVGTSAPIVTWTIPTEAREPFRGSTGPGGNLSFGIGLRRKPACLSCIARETRKFSTEFHLRLSNMLEMASSSALSKPRCSFQLPYS